MEYRTLGRSGLSVSRLCLGTMMFGGPTDAATSARLIARAAEAGINFLDTADAYNGGRSEEVVGQAIAPRRHDWVVATKIANKVGPGRNEGGLSRKWVVQGAEACLRRLGTDFIDILYLHKEDHATPLETTVRAIADLVRAGKIRHFGVSNYRSWRTAEMCQSWRVLSLMGVHGNTSAAVAALA
jgi:aryl-alcohol dehydrogenase-like predicted oxidoreductase